MLFWIATSIFVVSTAMATFETADAQILARRGAVCLALWLAAFVISRPAFPETWAIPLASLCVIIVTGAFEYEFWYLPTAVGFGYILMMMIGAGPLILSPMGLAFVGLMSVLGVLFVVGQTAIADLGSAVASDWVVAAITAEVISFILLLSRLQSIDELGELTRQVEFTSTTDALTGLYSRRGFNEVVTHMVTLARVSRSTIYAFFVDIDWLKTANDLHGHEYGDEVIRAVADAVLACAPKDSLVARWGGDEFLIFGSGTAMSDTEMHAKILEHLSASNLDLTKWRGTVSVGSASAPATDLLVEQLIHLADEQMFTHRRANRESQ